MTVAITSPLAFLNAIRFATVDQTQLTRMRYIPSRQIIELITQSRNSQVFIRGTLYLTNDQIQSQIVTNAPLKTSMFADFDSTDFDFTVPSKALLKATQGLANLLRFASPLPPVFKISFPDDHSPLLSFSGAISQIKVLQDKESEIKSFYQIHTTQETVDFPYAFSPSNSDFYAVLAAFPLAALIDSLSTIKPNQPCKIKFTAEKTMKISATDDAGIAVVGEMPNYQVGKSWILEDVKFTNFEGHYSFSGVKSVGNMLKFVSEGDAVVVIGRVGGEVMFRLPVGQGDRVCGQFVVVLSGVEVGDVEGEEEGQVVGGVQ